MTPQRFAESNIVMRAPKGMPECNDVHAWTDGEKTIVAFRPDPSELVRLNLGEPLFIHICQAPMPPVGVSVGSPFETGKKEEE
jgi:hypothetical protein